MFAIFHLTWMKVDIADAHKSTFIYCSVLKNRHTESHIVSRDVSKFKFHYVGSLERYDILQVKKRSKCDVKFCFHIL